jgi:UDP-2,3-diacylglucosamine hydrolase
MSVNRYLFVSDLHLDATNAPAIEQFLTFLANDASDAAALFILGDLFETWVGDDDNELERSRVCHALRNFTLSGRACYILRGNRDFLLGDGFRERTGCMLLPDPARVTLGALTVIVTHGDPLCTGDTSYQEFRSLIRNPQRQQEYLQLPLGVRRALADVARHDSKTHTSQTAYDIMDVEATAVETLLRVSGCDLLIHGHTHRPGMHELTVDGRRCRRLVLGDWYEQGSVLELSADGSVALKVLPRAPAA